VADQAIFYTPLAFAFFSLLSVKIIGSQKKSHEGRTQMLKLYDFKSSPNCQRVKVVLEEKKIPYETVNVDLRAGEQKTPDYLKINPYGKVPAIADGDNVLYESCIINEYLADENGLGVYKVANGNDEGRKRAQPRDPRCGKRGHQETAPAPGTRAR
jgi:glutaredoxin